MLIALKNPTRGDFSLPAPIIIIILIVILIVFFSGIPITIMNTITIREDGGALSLSEKQKQGVFQCNHMFRRDPERVKGVTSRISGRAPSSLPAQSHRSHWRLLASIRGSLLKAWSPAAGRQTLDATPLRPSRQPPPVRHTPKAYRG